MRSLVSQVDLLVARATGVAARGTCQQKAGKRERANDLLAGRLGPIPPQSEWVGSGT